MSEPKQQEVLIRLEVSLTVSTKHDAEAVRKLVEAGARKAWPNNHKIFQALSFAEEAAIYSTPSGRIRWTHIFRRSKTA
jgi:hypothetical protein